MDRASRFFIFYAKQKINLTWPNGDSRFPKYLIVGSIKDCWASINQQPNQLSFSNFLIFQDHTEDYQKMQKQEFRELHCLNIISKLLCSKFSKIRPNFWCLGGLVTSKMLCLHQAHAKVYIHGNAMWLSHVIQGQDVW